MGGDRPRCPMLAACGCAANQPHIVQAARRYLGACLAARVRIAIAVSGLNAGFDPQVGAERTEEPKAGDKQTQEKAESGDVLTHAVFPHRLRAPLGAVMLCFPPATKRDKPSTTACSSIGG